MKELFSGLFNSQTIFLRALRGVSVIVAFYGVGNGWWSEEVAGLISGGAVFMGAGEMNKK